MKKLITSVLTCLSLGVFAQGTAMEFDGVDDFITTDFNAFTATGSRTVEAWIKASSDSQQRFITDMGGLTGPGSRFSFKINPSDNNIRIEVGGGGLTGSVNVTDNNWHHVAVTYDATASSDKYKLYVDGALDTEGDISTPLNTDPTTGAFMIGVRTDSSSSTMFDGSIDEVRVYNEVRTLTELQASMNNELCIIPTSLQAYYKLNDGVADADNTALTVVADEVNASSVNTISSGFSLNGTSSNFVDGIVDGPVSANSITVTSCGDYTSPDNNIYTSTGIYMDTLPGAFCDSVITIDLTIPVFDVNVTNVGGVLTSTQASGNYQWIDCDNASTAIAGETAQSFTPTADGNYAVIVSDGTCSDTSVCTAFTVPVAAPLNNASMHFDGTDDKIETNAPGIQGDNPITVEAWVKTEALNNEQIITTWGTESYNGGRFTFRLNQVSGAYVPRIEIKGGGINGSTDLNDGQWHHVAVTYDPAASSNAYKLFVDGTLDTEDDITQPLNIGNDQTILISKRINPGLAGYFSGSMDEIKVWSVAKTQAEIAAGMNAELCNIPSDLVMYYNFNEGVVDGDNTARTTSPDYTFNSTPGTLFDFTLNGTTSNYTTGAPVSSGLNASMTAVTNCGDYTWAENTTTYSTTGLYTEILQNINSCDSIVVLDLTVIQPDVVTDQVTSCGDYTWAANGMTYTASGVHTETLQNINGCDSTVTLDLTVASPNTGVDVQIACDSYTWIDGNTYTASNNTATHTLTNVAGCDSVVTLDLTINASAATTETVVNCGAYTWSVTGTQYVLSGTYSQTLQTVTGCDSVVTLDLTINPDYTKNLNITACDSYTWSANGMTYTTSGTHTEVLQSVAGCDSTVNLNLTITSNVTSTEAVESCGPYTWPADGMVYTATGQYTAVLSTTAGCDSTVTLDLTVVDLDNGITDLGNGTFTSDDAAANTTYQWYDCNASFAVITGETNKDFTPTSNGNYAVGVFNSTCADTSSCLIITTVGLEDYEMGAFEVYPNPSNGIFNMSMEQSITGVVTVSNLQGKVVYTQNIDAKDFVTLDLSSLTRGSYLITVVGDAGKYVTRIVKN